MTGSELKFALAVILTRPGIFEGDACAKDDELFSAIYVDHKGGWLCSAAMAEYWAGFHKLIARCRMLAGS